MHGEGFRLVEGGNEGVVSRVVVHEKGIEDCVFG